MYVDYICLYCVHTITLGGIQCPDTSSIYMTCVQNSSSKLLVRYPAVCMQSVLHSSFLAYIAHS